MTAAVPLVERLAEVIAEEAACGRPVALDTARALLPVVEQAVAEARGEAWDEGMRAGHSWHSHDEPSSFLACENPYRADAIATTEGAP